jgi:Rap1a immunity proteins
MGKSARLWMTAVCGCVLATSPCKALETGNEIREPCRAALLRPVPVASAAMAEFCIGFVQAILNIRPRLERLSNFCPPNDTTTEQAARVMLKFLDDHPEDTHLRPEFLAVRAFQTTWPCR